MAYTRAWNSSSPLGTIAANTIDTEFQNLKGDLEERLEDKFITDVVVDPWVVRPEILGNVAGKTLLIHHSAFREDGAVGGNVSRVDLYAQGAQSVTSIMQAPLLLSVGASITSVQFSTDRGTSFGTITCVLLYNDFTNTPATTTIGTIASSVNGITILAIPAGLPHAVLPLKLYFLKVTLASAQVGTTPRFYGAKVTYDVADCRVTL